MDFARGTDGEVGQQFRHGSASYANPTPPTGGSSAEQAPQGPSANDPQVRIRSRRRRTNNNPLTSGQFDIFEWYPKYQSCQRYFVNHAQQSNPVQAVAAFMNISLPFQRHSNPISGPEPRLSPGGPMSRGGSLPHQSHTAVSLVPFLRRLVVTGLDFPGVLHGFFGDDWASGVGPLHEQERRNYLFAAKSGGWASVKRDYDMSPLETVPFMRPLQGPIIAEIEAAEKSWSEWLAMEDWMVGPRAPENMARSGGAGAAGGPSRGGGESSRSRG